METLIFMYCVGIVVGMYASAFEYIYNKIPITFSDFIAIVTWNVFAWYIFLPWTVGDFIYKKIRNYYGW